MTPDLTHGAGPDNAWIALSVFGPMAAAIAAMLARGLARLAGLTGSLAAAAAAAGLVLAVRDGPVQVLLGDWTMPLGITLKADGFAALMIAMTAGVGLAVALFADGLFGEAARRRPGSTRARSAEHFWPIWLILIAGMNALFLSQDVFNLYVTLEVVSLAAVALAALGGGLEALRAAAGYLLAGLAGSLLFLLGVDFLYAAYGRVDLQTIAMTGHSPAGLLALVLLMSGLAVKAALFPLHFWMPAAHSNALSPASAILSALVVKAALYIAIRIWISAGPQLDAAGLAIGAMGAAAILWGSVHALRTRRLKLLVAYSTVAQVGLISLAFALAGREGADFAWRGAIFLMLAHAVAKAAMFLAVGRMADIMGHDRIAGLKPASRATAPALIAFAIAAVSLIGLPPSGGFVGKWLLLQGVLTAGAWFWLGVLVASTALSATYLWRVISRGLQTGGASHAPPRGWHTGDALAIGLAALSVGLGLAAAGPLGLLDIGGDPALAADAADTPPVRGVPS